MQELRSAVLFALAGIGFRCMQSASKVPFDVVKQRLQIQGSFKAGGGAKTSTTSATAPSATTYKGTTHAFRKIFYTEGTHY